MVKGQETEQRVLALASLVTLGAAAVLAREPFVVRALPAAASAAFATWGLAHPGAGGAIAVMAAAVTLSAMTGVFWLLVMPLAILAFFIATRLLRALGDGLPSRGRVPLWETALCGAVTPVALLAWLMFLHPDVSDLVAAVPHIARGWLFAGAAGFALFNALFEELIWRGVFQSRLAALFGSPLAIVLQAVSFGVAHAHGFPRGVVGVALVTIWALMLGTLRVRAAGLLAPVLAHVVADATIACVLILRAR